MIRVAALILVFAMVRDGFAEPMTLRAVLAKDTAWTGESVPLIVTLFSPGPFSGSASFDLPELSRTTILRGSSAVVGSEAVDGVSYLTQRHELTVYTQNTGEIVLPSFRVRFAGKTTFLSDPQPMEAFTPELRFQSKRPPGTDSLGLVVAATEMEVAQTWRPASTGTLFAGDVIERIITRRATGTTAMLLPPVSAKAPEGVRVYAVDPIVQDQTQRGLARAERIDTIKYQFATPGTWALPDLQLVWWDPQVSEVKRQVLRGETVSVNDAVAAAAEESQPLYQKSVVMLTILAVGIGLAVTLTCRTMRHLGVRWRAWRNSPEVLATRCVLSTCRANNAPAAYAAFIQWARIVLPIEGGPDLDQLLEPRHASDLRHEWQVLSKHIFGSAKSESRWSGQRFAAAFVRGRRVLKPTKCEYHHRCDLPQINPDSHWPA